MSLSYYMGFSFKMCFLKYSSKYHWWGGYLTLPFHCVKVSLSTSRVLPTRLLISLERCLPFSQRLLVETLASCLPLINRWGMQLVGWIEGWGHGIWHSGWATKELPAQAFLWLQYCISIPVSGKWGETYLSVILIWGLWTGMCSPRARVLSRARLYSGV